jgi:hypothetical protein
LKQPADRPSRYEGTDAERTCIAPEGAGFDPNRSVSIEENFAFGIKQLNGQPSSTGLDNDLVVKHV